MTGTLTGGALTSAELAAVRADFPLLRRSVRGKPLVYLDNGATTQKPNAVIERISRYYREENANILRGVYRLSQVATKDRLIGWVIILYG